MKVLVVAANWWALGGQVSMALVRAGFDVAAISPPASVVRDVKVIKAHYTYRPWASSNSILHAIKNFGPDFVVGADDRAITNLHEIFAEKIKNTDDPLAVSVCKLIERSLGKPTSYSLAAAKGEFVKFAQSVGVRCPSTTIIADERILDRSLINFTYPIVIKADESFGGAGVKVAENTDQARQAFRQLTFPYGWPAAFMEIARGLTFWPLVKRLLRRKRVIAAQEFIAGRDANSALVCLNGKILAGINVEAVQTLRANGPSTVIRILNHQEMTDAVKVLVEKLGLSGYYGFDFIIDTENRAWLLEMNPRVTPASVLTVGELTNLTEPLFAALMNSNSARRPPKIKIDTITLFPQGWERKAAGRRPFSDFYDVPWDEPEFVDACLTPRSRSTFLGAMSAHFVRKRAATKKRISGLLHSVMPFKSVSTDN